MKGTALTLLCALALTQASQSQRNSDGTKTCNCNPSEAQAICSDYASDGIQIAHENCNKFYQCFDGRPIPFTCPSNLMYNAELEICDWPQNVECGDRPIFEEGSTGEDEECDEDNNDGDNNGSDGNNEDNSDTTCNCNPSEAPNICKNKDSDGVLVAHENCNQFYKCFDSAPVAIDCPLNLLFNPRLEICDWPEKVECGDRVIPDGTDNGGSDNGGSANEGSDNGGTENGGTDSGGSDNGDSENVGAGNCDPSEAPALCSSEGSNGVLVAHENCNQFYICSYGKPVAMRCPVNLLFNPNTDRCDWPEAVECGDRVIPDDTDNEGSDNGGTDNGGTDNGGTDNGGSDNGGSDNGGSDNGGTDNGGSDNGGSDNGGNGNVGAGNCDPSEAPSICAAEDSDGVLVAHENCNQFYKCFNGKPVAMKCPGSLLFNPNTDQCDWPENVDCGERVIPDDTDNGDTDNGGSDNGGSDNGGSDNGGTDNGGSDNDGSDNGGNGNVGAGNCDPSEAPSICAAEDSDGVLVAHENCNQFYKCFNGEPVAMKCPGSLLFNPNTDQCDWPENVECGERVIPDDTDNGDTDNGGSDNGGSDNGGSDNGGADNGGSDNGGSDNGGNGNVGAGNCDPSEAPSICAAEDSDGVLVAHENCNQFYKCFNGKPVAMKCPGSLLFNPNTDQCDWPENVDCGERVIPDDTDNGDTDNGGSDNGGSDNGGSDNGGADNGGSDNGGSDNGGNGNVGAGNCDPSEAPSICAAEGSDGVLVAHENCNQYYICSNGKPVALKCPGTLLFNPNTDRCDWPQNVDCGERVIPDETDNGGSDNGGSDNGGSDNGGSDNGGTDNGGSDNGGSDNGGNGNVGAGNCDPSEAPSICAAEDSDGVLVAHENCNQFYKCFNGKPVAMKCPGSLLFNPNTDQCDWPGNVDCGERVIPDDTDNGDTDNGGSDNGGSDNGGSDNGGADNGGSDNGGSDNGGNGNVGAGNCDPSEAPSICAAEGSDGVLVAHENCNQYYICSNGKPVALKCPGTLLFNPNTDRCDWPQNVDCGERVIPDETDNGGSDNGGSDNGGSDNGGSDNGGSDNGGSDNGGNGNVGAGNCDPSEAPSICAAEDSDGVLVAHENCNQFYKCFNGKPVAMKCSGTLLFNPNTDRCDWPQNVDCGERVIPDETDNEGSDNGGSDNGGSDNGGSDNGGSDNGGTDNGGSDNGGSDNGGNGNVGAGNCDPSEAPSICAAEDSDGVLVAHENCNQFYKCFNGKPVAMKCPGSLLFNPNTDQCDWPENVDCGERVIPDDTDNDGTDNGGSDNGGSDNGGSDNGGTDNGGSDNDGSDNGGNGNVGAGNCDPSEAPSICAAEDSDGVLVAHENCNQFYKCFNGKPVAMKCPGSLLFNPNTDQCDWPENVECGERVIPDDTDNGDTDNGGSDNGGSDNGGSDNGGADNGGSDNGGSDNGGNGNVGAGNCDPSEAPSICAAEDSDGVLVAHENCNQFYKCFNGKPVAMKCPGSLLFNPNTDQCDWPENVDCGERVIPDETDNGDTDNGGSDNGGSDNGGNDNGGSDNGGSDNGDNGNVGTCNCDPSEAPSICAAEGSDSVLVAHENCNQFYKCFNGIPVALKCPGTLLFDPYTDQCDWPENVNCGERLIPDETDNGGTDNGGNDNGGSDNGDSENDSSDNGGSDNGGNDNNGGSGNTDPSEAPAICAADESNGVLVAHENCNQFYKCSDGEPVALICPVNLLFNPKTDQCDWPENVECGDRIIPDGTEDNDNGGGDNGGNDNGGSDNGGSDNGGSGSGGNSDPSEAGTICGSAGSDGVLVAHEKCNKFYMCTDGIPVPILCSSNLLFNPSLGVCDWPRNVDCGDRIIPESDDVCLCNARQAPSICSGEHSNGLLIAHEYCNQYYVCVNGSPVARRCPLNHLYNPHEAACDWAQNVSCDEREVSYSLNKHVDARQTIRF